MVKALELILDLVVYQISGIEFCADTKKVVAILRLDEISYTFGAEQKIAPVLIRDNREYLVIDLKKTFNLPTEKFTIDTRAILMEMDSDGLIFLVDKVVEIISVDSAGAIVSANYKAIEGREFVEGLFIYEDRQFVLPDYHKIFWDTKV